MIDGLGGPIKLLLSQKLAYATNVEDALSDKVHAGFKANSHGVMVPCLARWDSSLDLCITSGLKEKVDVTA